MPRNQHRFKRRIALAVLAVGALLPIVIALLPMFVSTMATPLHPEPQRAPSLAQSDPAPQWSDAVNRARQIVRTALAAQNLPGLSVAVGAGGNVVWAEGFGWSSLDDHSPVTPKTRFRIASASEVLTSAAIGALLQERHCFPVGRVIAVADCVRCRRRRHVEHLARGDVGSGSEGRRGVYRLPTDRARSPIP